MVLLVAVLEVVLLAVELVSVLEVVLLDCGMALELEPLQLSEMCCRLCTFSVWPPLAEPVVEAELSVELLLLLPLEDVPVMATVWPLWSLS